MASKRKGKLKVCKWGGEKRGEEKEESNGRNSGECGEALTTKERKGNGKEWSKIKRISHEFKTHNQIILG